jgi:predicted nucleotidyltransferase component of viral defense system
MKPKKANLAESVRAKLKTIARERHDNFDFVLVRFAQERLLYRLSQSTYSREFVLKGATLLLGLTGERYRPTRDLDLLGFGKDDPQRLEKVFRDLCRVEVEADGLEFDPESIQVSEIREDREYQGKRIALKARLGNAIISLLIDVAFGDAVKPEIQELDFPTLLDMPTPHVRAYSLESIVAEKFQAMTHLGIANSRMKDFFDLYEMAARFRFTEETLSEAIRATFERRKTPLPTEPPLALTEEFSGDSIKQTQWRGFLGKSEIDAPERLDDVIARIRELIVPILQSISSHTPLGRIWEPGGPWIDGRDRH